jgi:hypothetical protein
VADDPPAATAELPPAGWYPDPHDPASTQRYWDGAAWTDSYAPIDTPVVDPRDPPLPIGVLQAVAVAGLIVVGFIEAFNLYADLRYIGVVDELLAGGSPSGPEIDAAERVVDVASIAFLAAYLLIGPVSFLLWFFRAYANLPRLGMRNLRYTPGWAIGSWFIPIFNLFRPKQIADDLYRATHGGTLHSAGSLKAQPVSPLLHWWWALFLLQGFLANTAARLLIEGDEQLVVSAADSAEVLRDERAAYLTDVVASGVAIVAIALAVLVVRRITADQEAVRTSPEAMGFAYTPPSSQPPE